MSDLKLPPIWMDPAPRFDYWAERIAAHGAFDYDTVEDLLAIGAAETGLDSFKIGNNAKNGTPEDHPAHYGLGYGVIQVDSYYAGLNILAGHWDGTLDPAAWRQDEMMVFDYINSVPGFKLYDGENRVYLEYKRWMVWPKKSDVWVPAARSAMRRLLG